MCLFKNFHVLVKLIDGILLSLIWKLIMSTNVGQSLKISWYIVLMEWILKENHRVATHGETEEPLTLKNSISSLNYLMALKFKVFQAHYVSYNWPKFEDVMMHSFGKTNFQSDLPFKLPLTETRLTWKSLPPSQIIT